MSPAAQADAAPLLSPSTALFSALLFTLLYLAPFYLSPALRTSSLQSRDAPSIIRARSRAVALACMACTMIAVVVLTTHGHASPFDVLHLLGIWPVVALDVVKTIVLLAVLFIGPLYESLLVDGDWCSWSPSSLKEAVWDRWTGYRNLIIAPVSEELVFRSLVIAMYLLAKVDAPRIVFETPLVFGLAHVHHLVEFVRSHTPAGRTFPPINVLLIGILQSLFMFTYTSLFGFFAAFLFLRTGSLFTAIAAHVFCNWQGVPRVSGRVGQFAAYNTSHVTHDVTQSNDAPSIAGNPPEPQNLGIAWSVVYYALLLVGSYGFYKLLWPLTESSNALIVF
ncbi:Hypothetical protein R9X50_00693800 [Acrodontium crateriforme]|uniref:intramembrane prenyl-peptidase Rce1 n=1 Tax=Acrodontium crateriforme TaxID=150365 RepID=A0AAQ3M9D6_9PEZI|nr:Hypothetical protein R9X50_00693800 [Acrodontium crateriforme]